MMPRKRSLVNWFCNRSLLWFWTVNIDFSRDIEAKRQYARQVDVFFEFVKKKQETSQEQPPLLVPPHNGGLWMGPEGKHVLGLELPFLDFKKAMSFLTRLSA